MPDLIRKGGCNEFLAVRSKYRLAVSLFDIYAANEAAARFDESEKDNRHATM